MLTGLFVTAMVETASLGSGQMHCSFPATRPGDQPIEIVMRGRPSLKDLPGLYRVEMAINGTGMKAAAQPILGTEGRDVLVRASSGDKMFYAVGFDDRGAAALNVVWVEPGEAPGRQMTRVGHCENYERYIQTWSTS